ncbi:hypothetical protein B0J18DRAFT_121492 [Chaetomium sp. MPI-SDFR-AT-0129]|nr:hypothetical protein B0J18DRAFT_121492 [Chaetomium sp. MPI-SDFR-AT-0129]
MTRIAIAGAGGFAQILAQHISQTAHALLVLSRTAHPELQYYCPESQAVIVDYDDVEGLRYTLQGVDLVISTISGNEQLNLIDAARKARVKTFVPSEFEGSLSHRPAIDPLDRGSQSALQFLERWSQSKSHRMRYTVFSCGIFMERFSPGGMQTLGIGAGCGVQGPDDYLVNLQGARAEIIATTPSGTEARVSMTSVHDVAQFVTAALDISLNNWPKEFKMRGDSMTVQELVQACSNTVGTPFMLVTRHYQEVEAQVQACQESGDWVQWHYFHRLLQTASERYHIRQPNLNDLTQVQPMKFETWLESTWSPSL